MSKFILIIWQYLEEIVPALIFGFFLSGLIYEFVPRNWVEKNLGRQDIRAVFYATIVGTILPICCWGALPIAIGFYKKGSKLGPVLAFLVATPATSVSAVVVTYRLLGLKFTIFIFFAVIFMGVLIGIIGNRLSFSPKEISQRVCPHCEETIPHTHKKNFFQHIESVLKFAFLDMPREIGLETILGIVLAAVVASFIPIGLWIKNNLGGFWGYIFALVFGLLMYICSTATVPLVDAFIKQGLNLGAGMSLLLIGPITSYGTILVLRKEFGLKILLIYLGFISLASLVLGYIFSLI
ncbi:MAG: permease [Candidatus Omnitrophica bacterium]|nr:permease [Candidatus Omnitrophota bacterium]MCM8826373.1 permease [Candidatus Omnitrophota bacterium]